MARAGGGGAPHARSGGDLESDPGTPLGVGQTSDQIDRLLAGQARLEEQLGAVGAAVLQALAAAEGRICGEWSARSALLHESSGRPKASYSDAGPSPAGPSPAGGDLESDPWTPRSQPSPKPALACGGSTAFGPTLSEQRDSVQGKPSSARKLAGRNAEGVQETLEHMRLESISASWRLGMLLERARQHPWSALRSYCRALLQSNKFEPCVGLLIIASAVSVGVEIQNDLDGDTAMASTLEVVEHVLLAGFVAELVIRMMANGRKCWNNLWFLADFVLVLVGVIASWVVKPALSAKSNLVSEHDLVEQVLIVRLLRLIRVVRGLRLMEYFQELWKLTKGLIASGRTVISALIMVAIVVYAFACFGVEVIYKSEALQADPVTSVIVQTSFNSLPVTMLTLTAFANADSVASIYVPLCQIQPWLILYFCSLWLVVTVSLMNLVTAVIVETAIASASEDAELDRTTMRKQLKKLVPAIKDVFTKLDADNEGTLTRDELSQADIKWPPELQNIIRTGNLVDLFEWLDIDESGQIDREEFVDGVCHLALSSVPVETTQMLQLLRLVNTRLEAIEGAIHTERRRAFGCDV